MALGRCTTVVNTPTVTFANAVTQVDIPQAILTAQLLGLGGATANRRAGKGAAALRAVVSANAERHAEHPRAVIADIRGAGHVTLRAVAAELNRRGMLTRRGGQWQVSNVRNLLMRIEPRA